MKGYTLTVHWEDNSLSTEQVRDIRTAKRVIKKITRANDKVCVSLRGMLWRVQQFFTTLARLQTLRSELEYKLFMVQLALKP